MRIPRIEEASHEITHLIKRASSRAALPYVLAAVALVVIIVVAGKELGHYIDSIESWIEGLKPWSVLVFVCLFALLTSILLPESVLSIMTGATFGLVWGAIAVAAGTLLGAALQFALSRRLLRDRIQKILDKRPSLAAIQRAVLKDELRLQMLVRLTPLNPTTISYVLGAAGVRFRGFMLACLAILPGVFVEVYFGYASKHVARLASANGNARSAHLHDLVVFGGLALCVVVMIIVTRVAKKALLESDTRVDTHAPSAPNS